MSREAADDCRHPSVLQRIDKELQSALDTLEQEKEAALKDLDAQVRSSCHPFDIAAHLKA